jgi:hypothetical protein
MERYARLTNQSLDEALTEAVTDWSDTIGLARIECYTGRKENGEPLPTEPAPLQMN